LAKPSEIVSWETPVSRATCRALTASTPTRRSTLFCLYGREKGRVIHRRGLAQGVVRRTRQQSWRWGARTSRTAKSSGPRTSLTVVPMPWKETVAVKERVKFCWSGRSGRTTAKAESNASWCVDFKGSPALRYRRWVGGSVPRGTQR
jgi:hypothetical protein